MDDAREAEIRRNKAIRGYIIRSLVKGFQNSLLVRQISNSLMADGLIVSPDIGKHLDYLADESNEKGGYKGAYIVFADKRIKAHTAYKNDAVIKLTQKGVDLAEGTIEDPGVDV